MATSSIFACFDITDKAKAEAFIEAIDRSANEPEWKPSAPVEILTKAEDIKEVWAKRKNRYGKNL